MIVRSVYICIIHRRGVRFITDRDGGDGGPGVENSTWGVRVVWV